MVALCVLASACAMQPVEPDVTPEPRRASDVELTLNLPEEPANCVCADASDKDHTFLERGIAVLADGDYIEAVQYFQRYERLEKAPLAQWEADIAIAYASILPSSPFFDVDAALSAYTELQARVPAGQKHPSIVLMQQALESFVLMERHIQDLEGRASMLEEDLNKREQALKRLRELTLGQPENSP
jgi:tetratricopeptide (TPR) repeat protein